jgi:ATP synthase F0 subunit b
MLIDIAHAEEAVATETLAEGGNSGGVLGSLGINPTLFAFQLINFAIVASIIWFLILKPLSKRMTERQKMIDESIDNAKKIQENLQRSELKFQEKIDAAKVEASKIIDKAGKEAEQLSADLKVKAKKEIELLINQAKRNIKVERDEMVAGVKETTAEIVVAALEKILSEKINDKKDKELVEEMIKKLQ